MEGVVERERRRRWVKSCPLDSSGSAGRAVFGRGGRRAPPSRQYYWEFAVGLGSLPYWLFKGFVLSLLVSVWSLSFLLYWVAFWGTRILSCPAAIGSSVAKCFVERARETKAACVDFLWGLVAAWDLFVGFGLFMLSGGNDRIQLAEIDK